MKAKLLIGFGLALACVIALAADYGPDTWSVSDSGANTGCGANYVHYSEGTLSTTGREIISSICRITASFTARTVQWNGTAVGADQYSQVTLAAGTTDYNEGVAVRMTDDTFYTCRRMSDASLRLARLNDGIPTTIDTQAATLTTPVVLRIEVTGTSPASLTCKVGGSTVIGPINDPGTSLPTGQPGFYAANTADFDNLTVGDIGSSSSGLLLKRRRGT